MRINFMSIFTVTLFSVVPSILGAPFDSGHGVLWERSPNLPSSDGYVLHAKRCPCITITRGNLNLRRIILLLTLLVFLDSNGYIGNKGFHVKQTGSPGNGMLHGLKRNDVERGMILVKPGVTKPKDSESVKLLEGAGRKK
jgi:hypothetical protein